MVKGKVLVTGCAGFIGSHIVDSLLKNNYSVIGIDNFNNYYNSTFKEKNLVEASKNKRFKLYREDILNFDITQKIFKKEGPQKILHLAARAGIRPSIKDPTLYAKVNIEGTVNLLRLSVDFNVKQFIFGSSSSVYGNSKKIPFKEDNPCDDIISPYGASKRAAEFWIESFWHTYGLKSVILRFFTVYGPRGRPDMAPALFSRAILEGNPINQFGNGSSSRDYTYIDDIVDGIIKTLESNLDFEIINLGNSNPITLNEFIKTLEKTIGKRCKIRKMQEQPGDVEKTWASIARVKKLTSWQPTTYLDGGLKKYIRWLDPN